MAESACGCLRLQAYVHVRSAPFLSTENATSLRARFAETHLRHCISILRRVAARFQHPMPRCGRATDDRPHLAMPVRRCRETPCCRPSPCCRRRPCSPALAAAARKRPVPPPGALPPAPPAAARARPRARPTGGDRTLREQSAARQQRQGHPIGSMWRNNDCSEGRLHNVRDWPILRSCAAQLVCWIWFNCEQTRGSTWGICVLVPVWPLCQSTPENL